MHATTDTVLASALVTLFMTIPTFLIFGVNVRFWPILLKNSFSADLKRIAAVIGCGARFKLGGYMEDVMSRCKAS
jgi:hypothetical protein